MATSTGRSCYYSSKGGSRNCCYFHLKHKVFLNRIELRAYTMTVRLNCRWCITTVALLCVQRRALTGLCFLYLHPRWISVSNFKMSKCFRVNTKWARLVSALDTRSQTVPSVEWGEVDARDWSAVWVTGWMTSALHPPPPPPPTSLPQYKACCPSSACTRSGRLLPEPTLRWVHDSTSLLNMERKM